MVIWDKTTSKGVKTKHDGTIALEPREIPEESVLSPSLFLRLGGSIIFQPADFTTRLEASKSVPSTDSLYTAFH
jgi:hypothetical protein